MKQFLISIVFICGINTFSFSQVKTIDSSYNNSYYQKRMAIFKNEPATKKGIVFLGNSITERADWNKYFPKNQIINRGIGGDNTFGILARLEDILSNKPKKIFIMIGINDIGRGLPVDVISNNYRRILKRIQVKSPRTKVYIQSVLPMNDLILTADYLKNKKEIVQQLNESLKVIASDFKFPYIDLYTDVFSDGKGNLLPELTKDGIHLNPSSYSLWTDYLKKHKYMR